MYIFPLERMNLGRINAAQDGRKESMDHRDRQQNEVTRGENTGGQKTHGAKYRGNDSGRDSFFHNSFDIGNPTNLQYFTYLIPVFV